MGMEVGQQTTPYGGSARKPTGMQQPRYPSATMRDQIDPQDLQADDADYD